MKIIFENDTERAEFEAINKGHRGDIVVIIGQKKYHLYATSMTRLQQDFDSEQRQYGFYYPEPNSIFVKETNRQEIVALITELYEGGFFSRLDNNGFEDDDRTE